MNSMKHRRSGALACAFASLLVPVSSIGAEIPARGPVPFATYDMDSNGLVSEAEFDAIHAERMATKAAEGRPMRGAGSTPCFSRFDANGDGQLTSEELAAGQQARMEKRHGTGKGMQRNRPTYADFDLDGDGKIPEQEFYAARSKRISERAQQGYRMKNLANAPAFSDLDTNGDGILDTEEFAAHQSQRHRRDVP